MLIANAYEEIQGFHSDIVGMYFPNLSSGVTLPADECSAKMDEYNWVGGWRAQDTTEQDIWFGGCDGECLFQDLGAYFILETSTMRITKVTKLGVEDILEEIERIDLANP